MTRPRKTLGLALPLASTTDERAVSTLLDDRPATMGVHLPSPQWSRPTAWATCRQISPLAKEREVGERIDNPVRKLIAPLREALHLFQQPAPLALTSLIWLSLKPLLVGCFP
jgi:hypothetical protein